MKITYDTLPTVVGVMHEMLIEIKQQLVQNKSSEQVTTPAMLVNSKQFCNHYDISMATLNRWRRKKKVPYIRLGGSYRYDLNAVNAALEVNRRGRS